MNSNENADTGASLLIGGGTAEFASWRGLASSSTKRERERERVIGDDISIERNRSCCVTTEPRVIELLACFIASMPREEKPVLPPAAAYTRFYTREQSKDADSLVRSFVHSFVRSSCRDPGCRAGFLASVTRFTRASVSYGPATRMKRMTRSRFPAMNALVRLIQRIKQAIRCR